MSKQGNSQYHDIVANSGFLVEGLVSTSLEPENLQLPDDHNLSNEDSSELNPSPNPSTSQGPDFPLIDRNLGSHSSQPRKPKIQADCLLY